MNRKKRQTNKKKINQYKDRTTKWCGKVGTKSNRGNSSLWFPGSIFMHVVSPLAPCAYSPSNIPRFIARL